MLLKLSYSLFGDILDVVMKTNQAYFVLVFGQEYFNRKFAYLQLFIDNSINTVKVNAFDQSSQPLSQASLAVLISSVFFLFSLQT